MKRFTGSLPIKLAILLFTGFCIFTVVRLQLKNNSIKSEIDDLSRQIEKAEDERDELKRNLDEPVDDDYVIDIAKDKLDLRLPEEIIFYSDN